MSELRKQMKMYMELKGYSSITIKYYLNHISNFSKFYNKSPALLGEKEICGYLHYCITEKHLREGSVNAIYAALKILYTKILNKLWDTNRIPRIKEKRIGIPCCQKLISKFSGNIGKDIGPKNFYFLEDIVLIL